MTGAEVVCGSKSAFSVMGGEDVAVVTARKPAGGRVVSGLGGGYHKMPWRRSRQAN
jgi:hypothetical protein